MNPEEDFEAERQALMAVFDQARRDGVKLDVEVFQEGRPSGSLESAPLAKALATHVRAVTGKAPRFEMCPGLLEIRFYAERGMQCADATHRFQVVFTITIVNPGAPPFCCNGKELTFTIKG